METFSPQNFLILIVDDISANLQMLGEILEEEGYATTFALSGQQALDRLRSVKPDLILLDLMMPRMSGVELCLNLQNNKNYQDIPIIFLTASTNQEHLIDAFQAGAVDYIVKPFNLEELLARIKIHLELKKAKEELQKAVNELEQLATIDELTGIPNRRYLLAVAEQEISRAYRYDYPLSLLMIDIDNFKALNDNYGHAIGDEFLQLITQKITENVRRDDCFGRLGGEEFLLFLPHTNTRAAFETAQRIRQIIENLSIVINAENIKATVSIGLASYHLNEPELESLLKRADQALLEAKSQGKNRVVVHSTDLKNLALSNEI